MKKKLLSILVCGILLIGLTGCGSKEEKVIITDNSGNKTEITYNDLIEIQENNEVKFKESYEGSTIEFTDTIEKIETDASCGKDVSAYCNVIHFSNGGIVYLLKNREDYSNGKYEHHYENPYNLSNFNVGDKIKVSSKICYEKTNRYDMFLQDIIKTSSNNGYNISYFENATIESIK